MNRLTASPLGAYTYGDSAHVDAATAIGSTWSASYDEVGNLTCRAAPGSGATCAGSSPTGALLGYDNEERLYGWQNAQTNPTQSAAYLYDGAGQRVQQTVTSSGGTTTTSYIGNQEEVTTSESTTTTTAYYGGIAESVNGALSYLLSDGLGSVSEAVSTAGTVSATQLYGPYGSERYQSGTLPTDKGHTGQVSDAASTGLDYYGARYYDPVAGQFTSADTTLAGGLNRYAYVGGNPETRTDPSGHVYAQRTTPYYQDFGAAVYSLIATDQGKAGNGMSTALFIASNDTDAYRAAQAYGSSHGVLIMPHVGEDANTYVQTRSNAYWNSSSAAMLAYVQLRALSHDTVVANAGVRSGDLNLFNADWQPLLRATGRPGPISGDGSGGGCGQSFTADTSVATPQGERPIASLAVGQQVEAYDPATGKTAPQTIVRVFLNHDRDRLDVTLATTMPAPDTAPSAARGHRRQAAQGATLTRDEVIHTTASHPWLTADHGWLVAGHLHLGEPVRLLDGAAARVVALRSVPGTGPMWDLSLAGVHTFAVGETRAVVHNCPVDDGGSGSQPTIYEKNASHIFRNADGHFPDDTPQNRQQLINVASDLQNFQGTDINGNDVYSRMNPDGTQTWAYVRNGSEIRNGGINQPGGIYQWNPATQLFEP